MSPNRNETNQFIQSNDPRLARILQIKEELEVRKALYDELDALLIELVAEGFTGARLGELVLELVDQFKECNTGWTSAAVKRFDLRVETAEKREARLARAAKKLAKQEDAG